MEFLGKGEDHRKAGIMFRQSGAADSAYGDFVIHGNGMPGLQWRNNSGEITNAFDFPFDGPGKFRIRLVRNGIGITAWIARAGGGTEASGANGSPVPGSDTGRAGGLRAQSGCVGYGRVFGCGFRTTGPAARGEEVTSENRIMLTWKDVVNFAEKGNPVPDARVEKTDEEWRRQLSAEEYKVTRKAGTERAFSSEMCSRFEPGIYCCVCCDTVLFDAAEKFESGTGWPSFTQPARTNAIAYHMDRSLWGTRVETVCNTCDAHLGHVFPDGPEPSGLRYCMNAVALKKQHGDS